VNESSSSSSSSRVGFCRGKKYFCRDLPGQMKEPVKTAVKTGSKFSALNWMEILRCNYNASLKLRQKLNSTMFIAHD